MIEDLENNEPSATLTLEILKEGIKYMHIPRPKLRLFLTNQDIAFLKEYGVELTENVDFILIKKPSDE